MKQYRVSLQWVDSILPRNHKTVWRWPCSCSNAGTRPLSQKRQAILIMRGKTCAWSECSFARGGVVHILLVAPTDLLAVKLWNQRPEVWSRPLKTERLDLIIARDPAGIQTPDYTNSWFKSLCVIYDSVKACWLNRKWSIIGKFSAFRGSQMQDV